MLHQPLFHKIIVGNATLYLGRCEDVMPLVTPVDCIVMDPPYEFEAQGAGMFRNARSYMNQISESGLADGFDHNIITNGRAPSVFVFCHNDQLIKLLHHLQFQYKRNAVCSWHKTNPTPVHNKHYLPDTEFYIHAWDPGCHPLGGYHDKQRFFVSSCGKSEYGHPTQKPIDLMNKIMKNANGELILDPFMGTGSTGVAALNAGKKFIGIEKEKQWLDVAIIRLAEVQGLNPEDFKELVPHA